MSVRVVDEFVFLALLQTEEYRVASAHKFDDHVVFEMELEDGTQIQTPPRRWLSKAEARRMGRSQHPAVRASNRESDDGSGDQRRLQQRSSFRKQ